MNREICLSISDHHDETWQPAWGIRTALTAIRSFMEGDAKGQVGGLDASEEARREWARLSRSWSCSICSEGKCNEDILREWGQVCREKGVNVDGQEGVGVGVGAGGDKARGGSDEVPAGLKFSYRDEMNGSSATTATATTSTSTATDASPNTPAPTPSTSTSTASATTAPSRPSSITTSPSNSRIPNNPQPSINIDATLQSSSVPDSSTWLDWAIIGVLTALVAMILKKIIHARSEI